MTIVEILVAISIVTVGVLGLLGELATDIKQQFVEKTQVTAVHLASGSLESAKSLPFSSLKAQAGTTTPTTTTGTFPVKNVDYTKTTSLQLCSASDSPSTCTTPSSDALSTIHATVVVTWFANGVTHTVRMARSIADNGTTNLGSSSSPLGSCGGSGTTLVSGHLALSPSSVTVNSSGTPSSSVTATLTETGLSNATCVPLTWSDDNGAHEVWLTGGSGTFSYTIPASSITKQTTSGGSVSFTATVPGSQAVPSAALTIVGAPAFNGNCSVSVAGLGLNTITLKVLTRNTLLAATVSCKTTNVSSSDSLIATYASGSGTKTLTLTSTDGTNWSATLPANSAMVSSGTSESFSFALKRPSDNATASQSLTALLA